MEPCTVQSQRNLPQVGVPETNSYKGSTCHMWLSKLKTDQSFSSWQTSWRKTTSSSRLVAWLHKKQKKGTDLGSQRMDLYWYLWRYSPAGQERQEHTRTSLSLSPTPVSAWLLASQRPEEMVLFPNTNYFLPPTTCSVGAPLLLPDSLTAQPPRAGSRA